MALEFKIELSGNFAGALEKNAQATEKSEGATKKHRKEFELFESEVGKASAGLGGFAINLEAIGKGGSLFTFDLAEGMRGALEVLHAVVEGIADIGAEMIKAAGAAEDLNLAIKLDVGEEGGEKVDKLAESFKGSRFSAKTIKEALLPILEESGDEHADQWDDLVTAATDVATRRDTGQAGAKSALEALRGIEIQPQRVRGALKELGIKQKDFYSDLGDLLGISAASAEKQTKAGQIKAQTLLSVALHQIAEREGGSLGTATNEGSKTLGATLERLGNLKESMFERLAGSEGMKSVQGFLDNFIDTLEGPIGTDLVAKLSGTFGTLFGDLSGPDGLEKMKGIVGGIAAKVQEFLDGFRDAWPEIKSGFEAAIPVVKELAHLLGVSVEFLSKSMSTKEGEPGLLSGGIIANNLPQLPASKRFDDRAYAAKKKGASWFESVEAGFNSGPFASVDDVPKFAKGGIVNRPTLGIFGEAGPEAIVPLGKLGGGGDITYSPSYTVGAGADSSAVRDQLEQFDRQARIEFKKIIDEMRAA